MDFDDCSFTVVWHKPAIPPCSFSEDKVSCELYPQLLINYCHTHENENMCDLKEGLNA